MIGWIFLQILTFFLVGVVYRLDLAMSQDNRYGALTSELTDEVYWVCAVVMLASADFGLLILWPWMILTAIWLYKRIKELGNQEYIKDAVPDGK